MASQNKKQEESGIKEFLIILAICVAIFFLIKAAINFRHEEDKPPAIQELSLEAIERAKAEATVISLDRGTPVGTLRLDGETYVIYKIGRAR